jgi:hypothetical protein
MIRDHKRTGLRDLLIADREHRLPGSPPPGPWSGGAHAELLAALKAGVPVVVSSAILLRAHLHAGIPHRQYAFGGADWGRTFLLDVDGVMSEY